MQLSGLIPSTAVLPAVSALTRPNHTTAIAHATTGFSEVDVLEPTSASNTSSATERTALQRHVDFFDRNNNGKITLAETYAGLRALGFGIASSSAFSLAINGALASATGASWSEPFTIYTQNIAAGKHPGDTDIYDEQGNYSAAKFEELFATFDLDKDGALSAAELANFREQKFETSGGSLASKAEFDILMDLAGQPSPLNGETVLTKERLAEFYDGSLFYKLAGEPVPF